LTSIHRPTDLALLAFLSPSFSGGYATKVENENASPSVYSFLQKIAMVVGLCNRIQPEAKKKRDNFSCLDTTCP